MQRFGVQARPDNGTLRIEVPDGAEFVPQVVKSLSVAVTTATVRRPSLDDVFLRLTGRAIREEHADRRAQLRMLAGRRGGRR
jgi:ABC-2 type transport system ATP-binding protein